MDAGERDAFVSHVWEMGRVHARNDLPWRFIDDAYGVYVSEVMLQQTQVSRVLRYWPSWMAAFPTIDALASASTSDVLDRWQGLGYNRRALALKRSAELCSTELGGHLPGNLDELIGLPGVGPATAGGIMAFAYQRPCVYLETNVRSVFIHHFFPSAAGKVDDGEIVPLVSETCSQSDPRGWYYALLDYGAHLKRTVPNPARKSKAYARQSAFEGSNRQKRSFIVREVLAQPGVSLEALRALLDAEEEAAGRPPVDADMFDALLTGLSREGFFTVADGCVFP